MDGRLSVGTRGRCLVDEKFPKLLHIRSRFRYSKLQLTRKHTSKNGRLRVLTRIRPTIPKGCDLRARLGEPTRPSTLGSGLGAKDHHSLAYSRALRSATSSLALKDRK